MRITAILGVDAGNISVADLDYIIAQGGKYGETATNMCKQIKLEPGRYKVTIKIPKSWKGPITHSEEIETKGTIVVGDTCYLFSYGEVSDVTWGNFLDKTDYLHISNNNFFSVDTGGDGSFEVTVTVGKIK